jgi:hypothetical protein
MALDHIQNLLFTDLVEAMTTLGCDSAMLVSSLNHDPAKSMILLSHDSTLFLVTLTANFSANSPPFAKIF